MVMARISYDLHKIVKLLYTVDILRLFFFLPKRKKKVIVSEGVKYKIYLNIRDMTNECLMQKVPKSDSVSIWKGKIIFLSSFFNLSLLDPQWVQSSTPDIKTQGFKEQLLRHEILPSLTSLST